MHAGIPVPEEEADSATAADGALPRPWQTVRINRAIDLIEARLDQPLHLPALAAMAHYSPFHFHRIFQTITGETCHDFVNRRRLTRVAGRLVNEAHLPIGQLALDGGFGTAASFSRTFQQKFGMSPSQWRSGGAREHEARLLLQQQMRQQQYTAQLPPEPPLQTSNGRIETEVIPPEQVAYLRSRGINGWALSLEWEKLYRWYRQQTFASPHPQAIGCFYGYSTLQGIDVESYDCCFPLPPGATVSGEIGNRILPGGRFALLPFSGNPYAALLHYLNEWLPDSGWIVEDREFREYFTTTGGIPEGYILVPVRRAPCKY